MAAHSPPRRLAFALKQLFVEDVAKFKKTMASLPDSPRERAHRPLTWREMILMLKAVGRDEFIQLRGAAHLFHTPKYLLELEEKHRVLQEQEELRRQQEEYLRMQAEDRAFSASTSTPADTHPRQTIEQTPADFFQERMVFIRSCIQSFVRGYQQGYAEEAKKKR